jgi:hypothetical protein
VACSWAAAGVNSIAKRASVTTSPNKLRDPKLVGGDGLEPPTLSV